jgi:cell division protein FtsB
MKPLASLWAGAVLLSVPAASALAARELPPGSLRVQPVEIVDRQGFERPMRAATMLVPAGWRHEAGVAWKPGERCSAPYQALLRAQAADGLSAIELLPGDGWGASTTGATGNGCRTARWDSAQAYLSAWVQQHRPGARWLDWRARPERSRAPQDSGGAGFSMRQWVDSGQALIAYTRDGRELRETLAVTVSLARSQMQMPGMGSTQSLFGQSLGVLAWRAPAGQLDFRHFDAVWASLQADPTWQARVNEGMQRLAQDNQRTQAEISRINAQTSRETLAHIARRGEIAHQTRQEIYAMQSQGWQARQDSQARMHTDNVRTVREVQAWREPGGGVVELSHHYPHAWRLKDGSYLLTDNPQLNPARDLGIDGEALVRTR